MGDRKNAMKKLQQAIKSVKYQPVFDLKEMDIGSPREYLKFYHYLFLDYSPLLANEILTKHNMELNSKNDKSFIDGVYKLMRDMFNFVPKLTRDHFFIAGYAQVKAAMTCEIIALIQGKVKSLQPQSSSCLAPAGLNSLSQTKTMGLKRNVSSSSIETTSLSRASIVQNHRTVSKNNLRIGNNSNQKSADEMTPQQRQQSKSPNSVNQELNVIAKAFENFTTKFESLNERITSVESAVSVKYESNIQQEPVNTNDMIQVSRQEFNDLLMKVNLLMKQNENFKARITVLETQNLLAKQSVAVRESIEGNTGDDTMFHSFIDTSKFEEESDQIGVLNEQTMITPLNNKKGLIFQGELVDFDKIQLNDQSTNSADLTPTILNASKSPNFSKTDSILRAKELVSRASEFNKILENKSMKSM